MEPHIEIIKPDESFVRITEEVLAQNRMVLEMNAQLLREISSPMFVLAQAPGEKKTDK